ncbi:MAG: type IX secretion system sortase PorU [Bacteroidales bacterium]
MSERLYFILFIFFFIPETLLSQQKITFERSVVWNIPGTHTVKRDGEVIDTLKYLRFDGAEFPESSTMLPYFSESVSIKNKGDVRVSINVTDSSELNKVELLNKKALSKIKENIDVSSKIVESRGSFYLQVSFIPLFKTQEGDIYKITNCAITCELTEEKTESKSVQEKANFREESVLKEGKWLKISVPRSGVYKLSYSQLKEAGLSDFSKIGLFGNADGVLPVDNFHFEDKDPGHNAVEYHLGGDGEFNEGDYILFFGQGPHEWIFDKATQSFFRNSHPYSDRKYYYVTSDADKLNEIASLSSPEEPVERQVTTFTDYAHHEKNDVNLIKSGREWFGERFGVHSNYEFSFHFPDRVEEEPVTVNARAASRSSVISSFSFSAQGDSILQIPVSPVYFNYSSDYARARAKTGSKKLTGEEVKLGVKYNSPESSSVGWLDFITVNATRKLKMNDSQLLFHLSPSDTTQIIEIVFDDVDKDLVIWDVTSPERVKKIQDVNIQNNKARFKIQADTSLRRFMAFTGESFLKPAIEGNVKNQNLHGISANDMVIVTKEKFLSQANELAELHSENSGLKTAVVTDKEIFNEFSSGMPDPAAIRNFVRYVYEQSVPGDSLKYLLMFGDGSYDNRGCHKNDYLMTYQSKESLHYTNSFVSDDFFGMIDETDNIEENHSGLVDIGIGRFPVNTVGEAQNAVDKVEAYMEHEPDNAWLNRLVFVADDEDNNDHVEDAEELSDTVNENFKEFDVDKIYLDAYNQVTDATGATYPEVNKAINEKVNNGAFLINYSGHGSENYLAHERILTKDDIASWVNREQFPVFMTATCEFTRFDDPGYTSAGEKVFLRQNAGGIALLSTTRLVYANQNFALNKAFFDFIFKKGDGKTPFRFGDVVRLTKNNAGTSNNKRNFSLFGDPALKLPIGDLEVHTDSIIVNDTTKTDTIRARDKVTIYGHLQNGNGSLHSDFNGRIFIDLKDAERYFYTKGNDGGPTFAYKLRANSLFKGIAKAENGKFKISFIVPNDVSSEFKKGKLIYWGYNENHIVQGVYDEFYTGGVSDNILDDDSAPEIKIYMNDRNFVSGGITNENPQLLVDLNDESGINISGTGVGHGILATIDKNYDNSIQLNQYYTAEENDYKKGTVKYQLNGLSKGEHTIEVEAWDINNNYSSSSIDFIVSDSSRFVLSEVYNNPNPFSHNTDFYFEHNRPGEPMDATLSVYDLSGSLLFRQQISIKPEGYRVGPVSWNGLETLGNKIGAGIYIYQIKLRLKDGTTATKSNKLMIIK